MSIEAIIKDLDAMAEGCEEGAKDPVCADMVDGLRQNAKTLREAITLLRTHPDNQPNEPLRWRSCKREKPAEKGCYEVVCRNGDIPPYVLLGFWNPDNPGWDLYGVTHWRPLPDPPKEA